MRTPELPCTSAARPRTGSSAGTCTCCPVAGLMTYTIWPTCSPETGNKWSGWTFCVAARRWIWTTAVSTWMSRNSIWSYFLLWWVKKHIGLDVTEDVDQHVLCRSTASWCITETWTWRVTSWATSGLWNLWTSRYLHVFVRLGYTLQMSTPLKRAWMFLFQKMLHREIWATSFIVSKVRLWK